MSASLFCYSYNGKHLKEYFSDECHSGYNEFTIALRKKPDNPLFTIITNGYGEGRFVYDSITCTYHQTLGTCQYSIPNSEQGIRKALRKELLDMLTERSKYEGITDEEEQILELLQN